MTFLSQTSPKLYLQATLQATGSSLRKTDSFSSRSTTTTSSGIKMIEKRTRLSADQNLRMMRRFLEQCGDEFKA